MVARGPAAMGDYPSTKTCNNLRKCCRPRSARQIEHHIRVKAHSQRAHHTDVSASKSQATTPNPHQTMVMQGTTAHTSRQEVKQQDTQCGVVGDPTYLLFGSQSEVGRPGPEHVRRTNLQSMYTLKHQTEQLLHKYSEHRNTMCNKKLQLE